MTVLSTAAGHAAPLILPPVATHYAAVLLFLIFGARMLKEGSVAGTGASDELGEVEAELAITPMPPGERAAEASAGRRASDPLWAIEEGEESNDEAAGVAAGVAADGKESPMKVGDDGGDDFYNDGGSQGFLSTATRGILLQAFTLTFVAEWGDRSQLATIALAADQEPFGVTLGGCAGHAFCTGLAVVGGKLLASRISERSVLMTGGVLFLCFAVVELLIGH